MALNVERVLEKSMPGIAAFRYAKVRGYGDADHASAWTFDDEQEVRDRWWRPGRDETVLDVGAAFGSYALPALAAGARAVCFSPCDFDTELLRLNLSLNQDLQRRCLVVRDGLYSAPGWFDSDHAKFVAFRAGQGPGPSGKEWLPVVPLDDFLEQRPGIERVRWMKIDVEGAELEVLRGGEQMLRSDRPKIVVENHEFHVPGIAEQVRDYLVGLGVGYVCDGPVQHCSVSHSFFEARG